MSRDRVDFDAWVAARGPALLRHARASALGAARDGVAETLVVEALARALPRWRRAAADDPEAWVLEALSRLDGSRVAGEAVPPWQLAARAREVAAHRRRARTRGTAVAVTVLTVLVLAVASLGLVTEGGDGPGRPEDPGQAGTTAPRPVPPSGGRPAPAGFRWESWHRLQVAVPAEWDRHARPCGPPPRRAHPAVVRPGTMTRGAGCAPGLGGFDVRFLESGSAEAQRLGTLDPGPFRVAGALAETGGYPDGAWVGHARQGRDLVRVVGRTREETAAVVGSVRYLAVRDAHGCPVVSGVVSGVASGEELPSATDPAADEVAVCRYDDQGLLEEGELLAGAAARAARAALAGGTRGSAYPLRDCPRSSAPGPPRVVLLAGDSAWRIRWSGYPCRGAGLEAPDGGMRELTDAIVYWALSPGYAGPLPGGLPAPEARRDSAAPPA